jgi:hypothetical protein
LMDVFLTGFGIEAARFWGLFGAQMGSFGVPFGSSLGGIREGSGS